MNCPLCIDKTLEPFHHGDVEIDKCPTCNGIWLDRDEIERLAAASDREFDRKRNRSDDDDDDDEDDDRRRARKKPKSKAKRFADRLGDALEDIIDL